MLSKCIGIISYFPDGPLRDIRKKNFNNLIKTLNDYFKLPIVIIAQNWKEEDFNIEYNAPIKIYRYSGPLGITRARIILREKLLQEDYDYFIFLDDDINFSCTKESVINYFKEIDDNPNKFGQFEKMQLMAISNYMLNKMNWDYIKDMEACRGEIWEEVCYYNTYKKFYKKYFFQFSKKGFNLKLPITEKDNTSTWYNKNINMSYIRKHTYIIVDKWLKYLEGSN